MQKVGSTIWSIYPKHFKLFSVMNTNSKQQPLHFCNFRNQITSQFKKDIKKYTFISISLLIAINNYLYHF